MKAIKILFICCTFLIFNSQVWAQNTTPATCESINKCLIIPSDLQPAAIKKQKMLAHHTKKYKKRYKKKKYNYNFPATREATGAKVFIFDPRILKWAAYDARGNLVKSGKASGGKGYCRDVRRACRTPRGSFKIHAKRGANCKSSKYPLGRGGAKMPYCMFFYKGYAIHGSYDVPNYNASHGCIRVVPSAAKWLHRNFLHRGTRVIVKPY